MLARFDRDVFAAESRSGALAGRQQFGAARSSAGRGQRARCTTASSVCASAGADVVLINPQYAPKVITKHDVDGMVDLIDLTAKETNVDLFERFAVMRYWRLTEDIPFSTFISPDELHMNDWSYGCVAKLLAGAIQEAATRVDGDRHRRARPAAKSVHTAFSAVSTSSIRSSGCSSPHDSRTMPSLMPSSARCCGLQPLVRRRRRMGDQALGVAEIVGDAHDLERVLERERALLAAATSNATSVEPPRICFCDDRGLRMVRPAGIDQPRHLRMLGERVRDLAGGVGLRAHAHRQRLQALEHAPRR